MSACRHGERVGVEQLPDAADGCRECLAIGSKWCHLRICLECGHVGCCDDSPNRHATAHFHETGHPVIRSLEPGETWSWCYVDEIPLALDQVAGATRIPASPLGC